MEKMTTMDLNEEEYEIITFYRKLPETKKRKFMKLLYSLRKILLDNVEA